MIDQEVSTLFPVSTATRARPERSSTTKAKSEATPPKASFAELVCLTLVIQGVAHGWALGSMLAPGGELGRIWSLSRPLTYRAIDGLVDKGLVTRSGQRPGQGRERVALVATAAGRRAAKRWLDTP